MYISRQYICLTKSKIMKLLRIFLIFIIFNQFSYADSDVDGNMIPDKDVLVIENANSPIQAEQGEQISVSYTIRNIGTPDNGSTINFWLGGICITKVWLSDSPDNTFDSNDIEIASNPIYHIQNGMAVLETNSFIIPEDLQAKDYYIKFVVDYFNNSSSIGVYVKTKVAARTISIEPKKYPDLIVSGGNVPAASVAPGAPISISATVKNQGKASAPASLLSIYLSSNNSLGNGDILLKNVSISALGVNQIRALSSIVVNLPTGREGSQFILFKADGGDQISEGDKEGNNTLSKALSISILKPDLIVESANLIGSGTSNGIPTAREEEYVDFYCTVKNIGNKISSNYRIDMFISEQTSYGSTAVYLGRMDASNGLNANERANFSKRLMIPDFTSQSSYYSIIFYVKSTDSNEESNSGNNQLAKSILIYASGSRRPIRIVPVSPDYSTVNGSNQSVVLVKDLNDNVIWNIIDNNDVFDPQMLGHGFFVLIEQDRTGNVSTRKIYKY